MAPFYAYAKQADEEVTWRFLIVFAGRDVADEWWRVVSTTTDANIAGSIERITPQFYTYNVSKIPIQDTILKGKVAAQTIATGMVPFQVIPPVPRDFADHLSGNWFYIRTPGPNPAYWYYSKDSDHHKAGVIVASRHQSTRFCITAVDYDVKDRTVKINSDLVELSFCGGKVQATGNGSLEKDDKAEQFKFGSFFGGSGGFRVNAYGKNVVGGLWQSAIVKTDKGDRDAQVWELSLEGTIELSKLTGSGYFLDE
ncbi:hypothetical protein BC629DRAFT_1446361 [Irpex lacteus]|nr:hypothetical protein BC629DRAFT_1446361 [Irpex lacteus]